MSWEAFGTPPDPPPEYCPLCGGTSHTEGCELGIMQLRALKAESEVRRLSAALAQPPVEPAQAVLIPKVVQRLVDSHAGKSMEGRVRPTNPCITAREGIVIADYIVALQGGQRAVGQQEETK